MTSVLVIFTYIFHISPDTPGVLSVPMSSAKQSDLRLTFLFYACSMSHSDRLPCFDEPNNSSRIVHASLLISLLLLGVTIDVFPCLFIYALKN
jgi:hypothetical protein